MDRLIVQQRLAEGVPVTGVFDGQIDLLVEIFQRRRRAIDALFLELQHLVDEARALITDAIALWHPHIIKEQLRGVRAVHADLVDLLLFNARQYPSAP
jgi:hypothetical protein